MPLIIIHESNKHKIWLTHKWRQTMVWHCVSQVLCYTLSVFVDRQQAQQPILLNFSLFNHWNRNILAKRVHNKRNLPFLVGIQDNSIMQEWNLHTFAILLLHSCLHVSYKSELKKKTFNWGIGRILELCCLLRLEKRL